VLTKQLHQLMQTLYYLFYTDDFKSRYLLQTMMWC